MSDINDLIQHALDQDYNKASQVFGDLMGQKVNDALEQEKIGLADQIFNGVAPEEDTDLDDEELDEFEDDEDVEDIEEDDEQE